VEAHDSVIGKKMKEAILCIPTNGLPIYRGPLQRVECNLEELLLPVQTVGDE
jgi:hypothetical protein